MVYVGSVLIGLSIRYQLPRRYLGWGNRPTGINRVGGVDVRCPDIVSCAGKAQKNREVKVQKLGSKQNGQDPGSSKRSGVCESFSLGLEER